VDLARERAADLAVLSEDEYQKVFIFYASFIQVCLVIFLLLSLRCNRLIAIVWGVPYKCLSMFGFVPEAHIYQVLVMRTSCGQ
jgi:hypothetical protein